MGLTGQLVAVWCALLACIGVLAVWMLVTARAAERYEAERRAREARAREIRAAWLAAECRARVDALAARVAVRRQFNEIVAAELRSEQQ